jgi:hypothetical protein
MGFPSGIWNSSAASLAISLRGVSTTRRSGLIRGVILAGHIAALNGGPALEGVALDGRRAGGISRKDSARS